MNVEITGKTVNIFRSETPVNYGGRRGKYVTEITFELFDPLPPEIFPSMVEFTQAMPIEEAKKRWPNTLVPGEEK